VTDDVTSLDPKCAVRQYGRLS